MDRHNATEGLVETNDRLTWHNPNEGLDCNNSLTVSTCPFWQDFNKGDTPSCIREIKKIREKKKLECQLKTDRDPFFFLVYISTDVRVCSGSE